MVQFDGDGNAPSSLESTLIDRACRGDPLEQGPRGSDGHQTSGGRDHPKGARRFVQPRTRRQGGNQSKDRDSQCPLAKPLTQSVALADARGNRFLRVGECPLERPRAAAICRPSQEVIGPAIVTAPHEVAAARQWRPAQSTAQGAVFPGLQRSRESVDAPHERPDAHPQPRTRRGVRDDRMKLHHMPTRNFPGAISSVTDSRNKNRNNEMSVGRSDDTIKH